LHDRFCAGFSARDAVAVLACVAPRPDVVVVTSEQPILRGADELGAFLADYVRGPTAYSWVWHDREAKVAETFGSVFAVGTETATNDTETHEMPYRMTLVAERIAGAYQLVQVHGSSPHHP
jgi:ketosteroid isomerase-like protein